MQKVLRLIVLTLPVRYLRLLPRAGLLFLPGYRIAMTGFRGSWLRALLGSVFGWWMISAISSWTGVSVECW